MLSNIFLCLEYRAFLYMKFINVQNTLYSDIENDSTYLDDLCLVFQVGSLNITSAYWPKWMVIAFLRLQLF